MAEKAKKVCPQCLGKKVVPGVCNCASEWRGTQRGDEWEDCQCTPEQECPTCQGTGYLPTTNTKCSGSHKG